MGRTVLLDMASLSAQHLCVKDKRLARVVRMVSPITYTSHTGDGAFPFLVHEVVEQMLSIKAGCTIYARLEDMCGGGVSPEAIAALNERQIGAAGVSASKVRCIKGLADAAMSGDLDLDAMTGLGDEDNRQLTSLHGIGTWTAKMYLISALDRPDVLPFENGAFLQTYIWAYKTSGTSREAVEKRCRKWKPYTSTGVRFFYRALDTGLTKNEFHLYK